ncbi:hypothetical protein IWW37_000986 [Coemansia sp. RSA 2050]|nr:hypothetical protein IWW37_000986 [Coemansia sp. RSA 2050]KAJ2736211.1 hypothetical protein IW152_000980 [Coemansia sp. BCRC 34962]
MLMGRYPELRFERWLPGALRSIKKTNGTVFDERLLRGPQGHPLCLWCGSETLSPQSLFCAAPSDQSHSETEFGEGCAHEHRMRRDNQYVRRQLFLRDGGICFDCGIDTHALFEEAVACTTLEQRVDMFKALAKRAYEWKRKVKRPLASMDYEFTQGMFWEAAHKVDVKHGGGLCGLDGFQTLCVPCHSDEYARSYLADIGCVTLLQSPTGNADTSLILSAGRVSRGLLSVHRPTPPRFALSPIQPPCSARSTAESPLALTPARAGCSRQHAETSPISLSSTSSSSLPSPTSSYILCVPPRLHETPTKPPPAKTASHFGGAHYQRARGATAKKGEKTPSMQPPQTQVSAVIDLTDMLTTINISSSGEESSSEAEATRAVLKRVPLSMRKPDSNSRKQGDDQQQLVARAKEGQARPLLASKPLDNSSTPRCPPLSRISSRAESDSQENSPAARGLAPLAKDPSNREPTTAATNSRGQLPSRHILLF